MIARPFICRALASVGMVVLLVVAATFGALGGAAPPAFARTARTPAKARHVSCKRLKAHSRKKKKCVANKKRHKPKAKLLKPSIATPAPPPAVAYVPTLAFSSPVAPILVGTTAPGEGASGKNPGETGKGPEGSSGKGSEEPPAPPKASKPLNTVRPAISGTTSEGYVLSASTGTWEGKPTAYAYQWQACDSSGNCTNIAGERASTYTLSEEDVGRKVLVIVEATNAAGTTAARSGISRKVVPATSPPPSPPTSTTLPTIKGTATEGATLQATVGSWQGSPTSYGYQWQDCNGSGEACASIAAATHSSYKLSATDVGHSVRVEVSATNNGGTTTANSAATGIIAQGVVSAGCTTTISSGLQSAIQSAAAGSVICLDAGSYGNVTVTASKSSMVTITAASGVSSSQVTLGYTDVTTSSNLTFEGLTIEGGNEGASSSPATHIHWIEDAFTSGLCIQAPTSANIDALVQASTFIDIDTGGCSNEGRLEVNGDNKGPSGVNGVVIANDLFETGSPSGCTDGVNITGGASGTVIGPGDEFTGLKQGSCSAHVDSIQFYGAVDTTVTGDYFHGNSDGIMSPDGNGSPMTVTNSVFDTDGEYPDQIVIGGGERDVISHDTFGHGARVRIGHVNVGATAANETVTNDVLTGGLELTEGQSSGGWSIEYNLVESEVLGAHSIKGKPGYVGGGSEPSTWAGWALTSASPGHLAAGDGSDMGTTYFGS